MSSAAVSPKQIESVAVAAVQPLYEVKFSFDATAWTDRLPREIFSIVSSIVTALVLVMALLCFARASRALKLGLGLAGLMSCVSLSARREIRQRILRRRTDDGSDTERVLIVGGGPVGRALATHFEQQKNARYQVIGFLDDDDSAGARVLGKSKDLRQVAQRHFIDEVFLTTPPEATITGNLRSEARAGRINVSLVEPTQMTESCAGGQMQTRCYSVAAIHRIPEHALATILKRELDVFLAAVLLAALSPLMLAVAIAVKLDSDGSVLYHCWRLGKRGRQFTCYKFRTMVSDAHAMRGHLKHLNEYEKILFKIREDPRITPLGKFLRKYSLDELPQLCNVLVGDMSLVGPRPPLPEEYEQYSAECRQRLRVKPGITGLWQVTARQNPSFDVYMRLDLQYVENWSLWWDLKILLQTIPAVLRGTGW